MIDPARASFSLVSFAQDAWKSLPYPLVQRFQGRPAAVFEISKPAGERAINDIPQDELMEAVSEHISDHLPVT
ncbi:MAG: hypothetical protein JWM99_1059 [Verrucomicrobiales bacterium]|nr:hypothetical protein [Verrucomicrobiales bacterium]